MSAPAPLVMPGRTHHSAPKFDGTPTLLASFFDDVEQLAKACKIDNEQKIQWTLRYAPLEDVELWKMSIHAKGDNWDNFKADIYALYPGSAGDRKYSVANLEMLTEKQAAIPMETSVQFGKYYRSFSKIAQFLKEKERLTDREISTHFLQGFDFAFRNKVRAQLRAENPTHHTDDPFKLSQISSAALFVLSCNKGDIVQPDEPKETPVTVKREQYDLSDIAKHLANPMGNSFNVSVLAQEIAKLLSMQNQQTQQATPYGNTVAPSAPYPTQATNMGQMQSAQYQQPRPRPNNCIFCSDPSHYLNSCSKAVEYVQNGRCKRNFEGQITFPNGERINPRIHFGSNLKERIDSWHMLNNSQNTLSSNVVQISEIKEVPNQEDSLDLPVQSQFTWIEVEEEVSSTDDIEPSEKDLEELHLLESLLNTTQKKVEDAKRKFGANRTTGPVTRSNARQNASENAQSASTGAGTVPKRADTPTGKPTMAAADLASRQQAGIIPSNTAAAPPTRSGVVPAPTGQAQNAQYKYVTPIESSAAIEKIAQRAMSTHMELSMGELLAISPDVRKLFKEQVTTKRISPSGGVPDTNTAAKANYYQQDVSVVQSFMAGLPVRTDGVVVANHSEKLRTIDVLIDGKIKAEAIMDEGSQIIGMRKELWEHLGLPVRRDHLVTMETANSGLETSLGLLQDLKLTIGGYDFYLQVQVVENAAYDILLGLPFHILTQGTVKFFGDGSSHLTLHDPNTGALIMVPTKERKKVEKKKVSSDMFSGF